MCRQHGARTAEEQNADYLLELTEKKGKDIRAAQAQDAAVASARYKVAEEKATRLTRMAPALLKMVDDLLVADQHVYLETADWRDYTHLFSEARELVAFIKDRCPAPGCHGVYQHLECPQCGGPHCPGH